MLRILMVLEDYGELMFLQTVLKKMGFDVDAIQNPAKFQDALLSMNPDVVMMTALGKKVRGVEMAAGMRRRGGAPRTILIRGPNMLQSKEPNVDAWLDSPVPAMTLLNCIGDLCGLNKDVLADKFVKLQLKDPVADEARVLKKVDAADNLPDMDRAKTSEGNLPKLGATSLGTEERRDRYKKFLSLEMPVQEGFSVKQVQDQVKALRAQESKVDLDALERERKAFVEHLFKKK